MCDIEKLEITITLNNPNEIPPDYLGVEIRIFDSRKYKVLLSVIVFKAVPKKNSFSLIF